MLKNAIALLLMLSPAALAAPEFPRPADAPKLPQSHWELKEGAPPAVAVVLERMKKQRKREFDNQLRAIRDAEKDLAARKAGRVVKELKAAQGWRAVPARSGGGLEYAFQTPQIKGREVVNAEAALEHAKRRLPEISHPDYLATPVLRADELKDGAAGTVRLTIVHQVSSTEAVARTQDEPLVTTRTSKAGTRSAARDLYLSDFPARENPPGLFVRNWTIEVIGKKTFQGENGRTKTALHAKPLDWRKWIEVRRPEE